MYVFDSSVLSAFCVAGRLDLLENRYAGRTAWTIEVQDEIVRGLGEAPSLSDLLSAPWLGEPVRSFAVGEIERMRRRLGGGLRDRRHSGKPRRSSSRASTGGRSPATTGMPSPWRDQRASRS